MTGAEFLEAWEKSLPIPHAENFSNYIAIFDHYFDYNTRRHYWTTRALQQKVKEYFGKKDFATFKHLQDHLPNTLIDVVMEFV